MSARHHALPSMRARMTARAMVLAVLVTAVLIAAVFPLRTYLSERAQIASLTTRAHQLETANAKLGTTIRHLRDPAYLEQLARECLGMVMPGEQSFVVIPKGGTPKPAAC